MKLLARLNPEEGSAVRRRVRIGQGLLLAIFLVMVSAALLTVRQSAEANLLMHEKQVRDGYAAQSDLHRLTNLILRLKAEGTLTEHNRTEIQRASDMLWVRTNDITVRDAEAPENTDIQELKRTLFEVVSVTDTYLEQPSQGVTLEQLAPLITAADEARVAAIRFIDVMRRAHDRLVSNQSQNLKFQNTVMLGMAAILTASGVALLTLLSREMLLRQAHAKAEQRALFLASNDPLTALPNRTTFISNACALTARQTPEHSAVWAIDIDHFKAVNDKFGHDIGDKVIKTQAIRINRIIKPMNGILARIAGDEFAAWLPGDEREQKQAIQGVLEKCREPINIGSLRVRSSISIGVAPLKFVQSKEDDIERQLKHADFALYIAKSDGKDRHAFFDKDLATSFAQRTAMLSKLRADIEKCKIDVYLQPKINLSDN